VRLLDARSDEAQDRGSQRDSGARDQAMFELLYGCGMRVGELVGLDVGDVLSASGEIRVFGKGRKERVLPMGGSAQRALSMWMKERAALLKNSTRAAETALFLGARGARIDSTVVRRLLRLRAQQEGIASHVHPHRLRHSFASHLLQASGDLRAVQELMGHASIASTQVYTHLDFAHLAKVYDGAHPRAKKPAK
jgi:integrase/recombinase XerC